MYPSTGSRVNTVVEAGRRTDRFLTPDGVVEVTALSADLPLAASLAATGNQPSGKGARGAIPLILQFDARDVALEAANRAPGPYGIGFSPARENSRHPKRGALMWIYSTDLASRKCDPERVKCRQYRPSHSTPGPSQTIV
jgi:hypothetical protein